MSVIRAFSWSLAVTTMLCISLRCVPDAAAQEDRFDTSHIPADTSILMSINVSRLMADGRSWESRKLIDFLLDGNLELDDVDQFQLVAGAGEEMSESTGGDTTAHLKLVFREPVEMKADRLAKITGSSLRDGEPHEGKPRFEGESKRDWGGFQNDEKTIIIAVNERAEMLKESESGEGVLRTEFAEVERDCDLYLALKRGPETEFFFMQMFGMDTERTELAELEFSEIRFKVDDKKPVWGRLQYANAEAAEVAEATLKKLLEGLDDSMLSQFDSPRRRADEKDGDELETLWKFVKLAQSIEIQRKGNLIEFELTVAESIENTADQMFGMVLKWFGHPSLSR